LYPKPTEKFEGAGEGQQRPDGTQAQDQEKIPLSIASKYSSSSGKLKLPPDAQEKERAYKGAAAKSQKNSNKAAGILQLSDKKNKKNKGGYQSIDDDEDDDFDEHEAALASNFKNQEKENDQNNIEMISPEKGIKDNLDNRLKRNPQTLNLLMN